MAISSEIEKLERRWQQTSGLVFAPLAEAYRKAGLPARALELLEQGLALHPEYGPALIVRARCHLDTGDLPSAEHAFNQALGRDPTDPIALRGLADVYERTSRLPEAIERLRALVDVDPRNSEARAELERLVALPPALQEAAPPSPEPEPVPAVAEPEPGQLDSLDFDVVNLSAVESLPALPEERTAVPVEEDFMVQSFDVEPLEVPTIEDTPAAIHWTPAPVEIPAPVETTPEPTAPAGETLESAPVVEAVESVESVESVETVAVDALAEAPPVMESARLEVEEAFDEFLDYPASLVEEPTAEEYASRVETPAPIEAVAGEPAPTPEPEPEGVTELASESAAAPVLIVTESMAELFVRQGHRELGLAVYRQLLERAPEADHLKGAIARLEQELAPPPPAASPVPSRAAAETGGRSVERRLQAVLHAPPPSSASTVLPPAIEPGAEPTRPAADALSLSAVFGDEPPATLRPEPEPAPASADPSYDEFFGASPSEPAAAPSPRGDGEDLRQFNEWLKGLKR